MKRGFAALLIAAALLIGLFLPSAVFAVQDLHLRHDEDPGIESVDLSVASGLNITEKIALFADPNSTLVEIGLGRYQTPDSLSALSWSLISALHKRNCPILDTASAVQEQQSAVMITNGETAFVFWRVLFTDAAGNTLRLCFDDETGNALGLSYNCGKSSVSELEAWAFQAVELIAAVNGLTWSAEAENSEWDVREVLFRMEGESGSCGGTLRLEDGFFGVNTAWAS